MTASIARVATGEPVDLDLSLQEYAHPEALLVDVGAASSDIAPLFIFSALLFPFVIQVIFPLSCLSSGGQDVVSASLHQWGFRVPDLGI